MITCRTQALRTLGLRLNADENEIKTAYKSLVKLYHPDSGKFSDTNRYNEVVEAYNFLRLQDQALPGNRVVGQPVVNKSVVRQKSSAADYKSFEKKMKKQKAQKAAEFERKTKEYSEMIRKQDEEYKKAMEAIDAIRVARALEAMVWANGMGQNNDE